MRVRDYLKPVLPPEGIPWLLVDDKNRHDGPFYTDAVFPTTLPHKPFVIVGGMPRILRVKRQKRNVLTLEDGEFRIALDPFAAAVPGWPRLDAVLG